MARLARPSCEAPASEPESAASARAISASPVACRRPRAPELYFLPRLAPSSTEASAPAEECDLNANTLVSARFEPEPASAPESAPVPTRRDGAWIRRDGSQPPTPFVAAAPLGPVEPARGPSRSYPPVVADIPIDEPKAPAAPSPTQIRRRQRLRHGVGAALAATVLLCLGIGAKAAVSTSAARAERHQATAAALALSALTTADARGAASPASEQLAPATEAVQPVEAAARVDGGSYREVADETIGLLTARKLEEASVLARRLIDLDPKEALGYRCLGAALQDLGRVAAARKVYRDCVRHATKGQVPECAALGGR